MLTLNNVDCVLLTGGMKTKEKRAANDHLATAQVIIATGKYVGEGFDLPRLDTLFITLPISWRGTLAQYAGRIHRSFEDKNEVQIYDYVEVNAPMLSRMYQKREKGYLALGYKVLRDTAV
nr:helicase-related protein [Bowmanella denitrificans]